MLGSRRRHTTQDRTQLQADVVRRRLPGWADLVYIEIAIGLRCHRLSNILGPYYLPVTLTSET